MKQRKTKKSGLVIVLLILIILAAAALLFATVMGIMKTREFDQKVQVEPAEVPAPTAEPTPEPLETAAPTPIDFYSAILTQYYQALSQRLDAESLRNRGLNYMMAYSYGNDALSRVGYALKDLDGDGTEELLIGCMTGDEYSDEIVLELFSIKDGAVNNVFSSGERDRYYFCSDGTVANEASSSAFESYYRYYAYQNGALTLKEEIGFDLAANRNDPWYSISADGQKAVITEGEATSATERYRDSYITTAYTPFSEVTWLKVDTAPDVWQGETNAAEQG